MVTLSRARSRAGPNVNYSNFSAVASNARHHHVKMTSNVVAVGIVSHEGGIVVTLYVVAVMTVNNALSLQRHV